MGRDGSNPAAPFIFGCSPSYRGDTKHRTRLDGPFAETKQQLLGLYVVDCASENVALDVARDLRRVNPTAVYEIRPIALYNPRAVIPETASEG
jgi:hypothetical protein